MKVLRILTDILRMFMKILWIVLKILKNNRKRPLSAYDVLDKFLRIKKVQPATVYRSLKNLLEQNLVLRLNVSKKYIVSNEPRNENEISTIVLCKNCNEPTTEEYCPECSNENKYSHYEKL